MDSVPVVFITANVPLSLIGTDSFQEVDITGITMSVTKHSFMVKSTEELALCVHEAFKIAESGRKGPVLIDIPKDILVSNVPNKFKSAQSKLKNLNAALPDVSQDVLLSASRLIDESKRPLILAGGGIKESNASESILALAKQINAPVCSSLMAVGEFPYSNELYVAVRSYPCPHSRQPRRCPSPCP